MSRTHLTVVAATILACGIAGHARAASMLFDGGAPYLSEADSPFAPQLQSATLEDSGMNFWLEDFEDGLLNTLGVSATYVGSIIGPEDFRVDSVDGDAGGIDGDGSDGHSLFVHISPMPTVVFTFDQEALGALPTHAGIVWTDGARADTVRFEAFDALGHSIGTINAQLGDMLYRGETAEDRFFGVTHMGGISKISMTRLPGGISALEFDHLQYGYAAQGEVTPLPPAVAMGLAGLGVAAFVRRRKA